MRPVALLIGIESYPNPSAALPGARRDTQRMEACCRALGADPSDVRVLSGSVTQREMSRAIDWLVQRLAEPGTTGLLHFAGHGRRVPGDWAMVTSDGGRVTLADLRGQLAAAPERDLTLVLDACVDDQLDLASLLPRDAVLYLGTGATPELRLGSTRQGALSWALTTVLERWTWEHGGPDAPTAVLAAARLLEALQTGVDLRVSPRIQTAGFLAGRAGPRSEPAPAAATRQVEGDTGGYKCTDGTGNGVGWVFVPVLGTNETYALSAIPHNWTIAAPTPKLPGPGNVYPKRSFTGSAGPFPNYGGSAKFWRGQVHDSAGDPKAGEVCFFILPTGSWPEEPEWFARSSMTLTNNVIQLGANETIVFKKLGSAPQGNAIKAT